MQQSINNKLKNLFALRKPKSFTVFVVVLGIYLGTASHSFLHTDGAVREMVAENLLDGELALVQAESGGVPKTRGIPGRDGQLYSYFPIGQSLLEIPFIVANDLLLQAGRLGEIVARLFTPMLTLMAVTSALIPALSFWLLRNLGYTSRAAFWTACLIAFGSTLWVVSGHTHNSVQETMSVIGAMAFIVAGQGRTKGRALSFLIAGAFFGLGFITRVSAIIAGPSLAILLLFRGEGSSWKDRFADIIWFGLGFAAIGWIQFAYSYVRFGNTLRSGYESHPPYLMPPNIIKGLSWFISPWRGMLIYIPTLWLLPFAVTKAYKKHRVVVISIATLLVMYVVFYSSLTPLRAIWGWGSYYLMPGFLIALLPIVELFDRWVEFRVWQRILIGVVLILGVSVQMTSVSVPIERHIVGLGIQEPGLDRDSMIWQARYAPLVGNASATIRNFKNMSAPQRFLDKLPSYDHRTLMAELFEFNLPDWRWMYQLYKGSELALLIPLYSLASIVYIGCQLRVRGQPERAEAEAST